MKDIYKKEKKKKVTKIDHLINEYAKKIIKVIIKKFQFS
jgi:hypothetical protein